MATQAPPIDHNDQRNNNGDNNGDISGNQNDLDDWLPITSSRTATWWYAAFHNVTAMVGAAILGLPYAMSLLGWGPGVAALVLAWGITLFTLRQMVVMHEMIPGKRFDRYHELGQYAMGKKLGLYIVVPQQLAVQVSTCILFMVTGGKSLRKFHELVRPHEKPIKLTYWIMIWGSSQFLLSHLPNFNSISMVSLAAAVMSLCYSCIGWAAPLAKGVQKDVSYGFRSSTMAGIVFDFFSGLGSIAFSYAGHNVVLEIQATLKSTQEKKSTGPMWKGVVVAYLIVAACYFPVALVGYWVFGNKVDDDVLISLNRPTWIIAAANLMVAIHVIGSYQVFAMPVFDMSETVLIKKMNFSPSRKLRFIYRTIFVGLSMFIGMTFPFFGGLLSFFGGFVFTPTSYFIPCIIWLLIKKPRKWSFDWLINWACIIIGVLISIVATIGGLRSIIISAGTYKFYS